MTAIFPLIPDGSPTISLEWETRVNTAFANRGEQRRAMLPTPRFSIEYQYTLQTGEVDSWLDEKYHEYTQFLKGYGMLYIPLNIEKLEGTMSDNTLQLAHSIGDYWFIQYLAHYVLFISHDNASVHEIDSYTDTSINLKSAPTFSYQLIFPAIKVGVKNMQREHISDSLMQLSITFKGVDYGE